MGDYSKDPDYFDNFDSTIASNYGGGAYPTPAKPNFAIDTSPYYNQFGGMAYGGNSGLSLGNGSFAFNPSLPASGENSNIINKIISANDISKVSQGNGYDFKAGIYKNMPGYDGIHKGADIKGNSHTDIDFVNNAYNRAFIRTGTDPKGGTYIQLFEVSGKKFTGNSLYIGHLASVTKGISDKSYVNLGANLGIMGSSGSAVRPKGFIHAHVELRFYNVNVSPWTHSKVKSLGGINLW